MPGLPPRPLAGGSAQWADDRALGQVTKPAMGSADLIRRASAAFAVYGRGVLVALLDDSEPFYVRADEAKEKLAACEVGADLVFAVVFSTGKYDPEREAVLLREDAAGFTVTIERHGRSEEVGGLDFLPVN